MLILGREEKNIMMDSLERFRVSECNSCAPNLCLNNGVCQVNPSFIVIEMKHYHSNQEK